MYSISCGLKAEQHMTRNREFDTDDVLNRAMHVFWGKGYKATSLDDLLETMMISKSSFYETFGNKHDLFLAAIEEYIRCTTKPMLDRLLVEGPFIEALNDIFDNIIELSIANRSGCMLANSAIEMSPHDDEVDQRIANAIKQVEDAWFKAIKRAQNKGEIPADSNPRALARFIVGSINGLMVISKANPHRPTLIDIKDTVVSAVI
jgi:TetR/AcrR family transcriptional repressor of nem operon